MDQLQQIRPLQQPANNSRQDSSQNSSLSDESLKLALPRTEKLDAHRTGSNSGIVHYHATEILPSKTSNLLSRLKNHISLSDLNKPVEELVEKFANEKELDMMANDNDTDDAYFLDSGSDIASDDYWDEIWVDSGQHNIPGAKQTNTNNNRKKAPKLPVEIYHLINAYITTSNVRLAFMQTSQSALTALAPCIYKNPHIKTPHAASLFLRTLAETAIYAPRNYMAMVYNLDLAAATAPAISDDSLFDLISRCVATLTSLRVGDNPHVTSTAIGQIADAVRLRALDIDGCRAVEVNIFLQRLAAATTTAVARNEVLGSVRRRPVMVLETLEEVNLSRTRTRDNDVALIVKMFTGLRVLKVDGCRYLTDAVCQAITGATARLQVFSAVKTSISDHGAAALCTLESLRDVDLSNTLVSAGGVAMLLTQCLCELRSLRALECALADGVDLPWFLKERDDDFWTFDEDGLRKRRNLPVISDFARLEDGVMLKLQELSVFGKFIKDDHLLLPVRASVSLRCITLDGCNVSMQLVATLAGLSCLE
ncbi:hypothetical protein HK100_009022, partial [Physocladia obscura]